MLVSKEQYWEILEQLRQEEFLAVDTETTGLSPYHGDMLFSIILSTAAEEYYFNFNDYENIEQRHVLPFSVFDNFQWFFEDYKGTLFLANAKFDLHMLGREGIYFSPHAKIHDVLGVQRLLDNTKLGNYSLDDCAKIIGRAKDSAVEEYIKEHGLYETLQIPGKKRKTKKPFYNQVPWEIIVPYGELDARLTYDVGMHQLKALEELDLQKPPRSAPLEMAYGIEQKLLPVVFDMERRGVLVDRDFCEKARDYWQGVGERCLKEFKDQTGQEFKDSRKVFEEVLKDEEFVYTEKGNASFAADILNTFTGDTAKKILEYRDAKSRVNFFLGFLEAADYGNVIHASLNQFGTRTGRFSSAHPNLQNLTKENAAALEHEFPVRRAFCPRRDYCFVMIDYNQMEYRLLLDVIGAKGLIEKVLGGLDVHQATADVAKITRDQAKTTNFGVLYGQGLRTLAKSLGVSMAQAEDVREAIFNAAPEIRTFINLISQTATTRGYITNWAGFRANFPDPKFAYKAANSYIQGGCAYVIKKAMVDIFSYLKDKKSKLILCIHDELVFEVHRDEYYILEKLKEIMETSYPSRSLPLTVSIEHSFRSLADKVKGWPSTSS